MRLTRTTAWVGGTAAVALLAATATWSLLVSPRQDEAAALREQTTATASTNDTLAAQVRQLELQLGDVPATRAEVARLREQVPAGAALPDLLRQVSALADRAGAELTGVTPTEPVVDPAAVAAATPTPAPSATETAAPTDDVAAAPTPVVTDPPTTTAVEVVPVTITAEGAFTQVQELLRLVQVEMTRAVLVRGVTMTSDEAGVLQLSLTAEVFTLPATPADEALAVLEAPSDADGSAPTAVPTSTSTPGTTSTSTPGPVPTDGATPLDAVAAASGTPLPTSGVTQRPSAGPTPQTTLETP